MDKQPIKLTMYDKKKQAMELAIRSQRGAPHFSTLIKVADEIYKWLNSCKNGKYKEGSSD